MAEEKKLNNILEEQEKLSSVEYLIQKINGSGIKLNLSKEQMKEILEAGKEVQKMAVKYGTNQDIQIDDENTFNGYGTYVVSVNEDNARQLGIKIASRKYGGTFYINNQPFSDFLQEKSFSPYWTNLVSDFKDNSVDKLSHSILTSDVKGNPSLEREQIALSTLLNLDLIEYKREQTFLYSVNIPDNDNTNYLLYNNPIGIEHAQKINEQLEKLGTSWRVSRNDIGKNIYFNVLSNNVFKGNQKKSSEFLKNLGYVGMQMDNANYIVFNDKDMSITDRVQFMKDVNGEVYGFAYQGQIYADEELVNSNVLAHEYTHIWDKYVQNNNPELWQHGKDILKGTSLWQEITEDKNYENLKTDDEILSECHARIVGKMAEQVLERIEREDGGLTRDRVIDWDKEVSQYIAEELNINLELGNDKETEILKEFLSMPMKDLMNEIQISKNWFEKTPAQLQKEQEREDIHTTVALNNIAKDIVIEPYSRKPEDIEAMKLFVANVSGNDIENITNDQAQAFINNLGTTEEAYLTAKANGTFEYTNNNPYSPDIYKTSEPKEILSFIEENAEQHILRYAPESEARKNGIKDYDFIHSVSENLNEIEKKMMEQLFNQSTNIADITSFDNMEFDDEGEHYSYYREIKYNEEKNIFIEKTTEEHWDKAYPYTKKNYYLYSPKEMFENHSFDFDDESVNKKFKDFVYEKYNKSLKSETIQSKTDLEHIKRDFSYIRDIFETGDSISVKNEMVGLISIDKGNIGKSGNGLQHICTQRFEKDGRSVDEITAMLALVVNSVENGTVSRNNEIYQNEKDIGTYDIEKNGIIAFVSKTRDGNDEKFVITGFDDNSKKIEASDAINAVIAENSYAPDFVIVKEQVVATLASSYMLHLNEIESNLLNPKKDNIKRINKELKLLENYKNSDEIKRYFKNNSEDFDKVKKSIKKIDDLTNTSSEYQDIKKRINDLAVINTNEEVVINKTALNTELEEAKKTIQEKDKELNIWTAKAEADKETINNLTEQLEQKDKIIQKQDEALRKEQSIHNFNCDITVPQRDSKGNVIIGKDGKPLTSTLHCTEGIDAALGKLSRKCVDLTLENKQLREQLNQEKNRNAKSQSDNSWSD